MKRTIVAGAIGGLIIFIWNALSWMVFQLHDSSLHTIPENVLAAERLKSEMIEPGVYHYPGLPENNTPAAMEEMMEKSRKGPVISFMVYLPQGVEPLAPTFFIKSLFFNLFASFISVYLLARAQVKAYGQRVLFVFLLGVFAAFASFLPESNWYAFPFEYIVPMIVDLFVGWGLAGFVIAKIMQPNIT